MLARAEPSRNHVRFSPIPSDHDWRSPGGGSSPRSPSPLRLDMDRDPPSSGDLIHNAHPNLNGGDPARAAWAQKGGCHCRTLLNFAYGSLCVSVCQA